MWLFGIAWNSSTYLVVALTLQRALSVLRPHRVHLMCTRKTTLAVIGGIALSSSLIMAHVPYGYDLMFEGNDTYGFCGHGSYEYSNFNAETWVYVELVTFAVLPFLCLALSNGVLSWKLVSSVGAVARTLTTGRSEQAHDRKKKQASSTTVTVMVISLTFVAFNLPLFVHISIYSAQNLDARDQLDAEYSGADYFFQSFVMMLLFCNFAVNFYLYCLTGSRFRNEFLMLFSGSACKNVTTTCETGSADQRQDAF